MPEVLNQFPAQTQTTIKKLKFQHTLEKSLSKSIESTDRVSANERPKRAVRRIVPSQANSAVLGCRAQRSGEEEAGKKIKAGFQSKRPMEAVFRERGGGHNSRGERGQKNVRAGEGGEGGGL